MSTLPMFPLSSVLFPAMPTALRVFEDRYLVMLARILQDEPAEFGIVLIERGREAGGGDQRFGIGTVARIAQLQAGSDAVNLIAQGQGRFEVVQWLDDDPHPRAVVRELPDLVWQDGLEPLLDEADAVVRRAINQASEFTRSMWTADAELSAEPVEHAWQLAGIAPLGPLDQITLLRATSAEQLLRDVIRLTDESSHFREVTESNALDEELRSLLEDEG